MKLVNKVAEFKYTSKWLDFNLIGSTPKTTKWEVANKSLFTLGIIKWHYPWRQYIFETQPDVMIFDDGCLATISEFLTHLNTMQKARVTPPHNAGVK